MKGKNMAFKLGDIIETTEAGRLKGIQKEIACDCWFTSSGKTLPRMIKIMDESGRLLTIHEIQLLSSEEKTYSGIRTVEHICNIILNGKKETVRLIYTKESCKWKMVVV